MVRSNYISRNTGKRLLLLLVWLFAAGVISAAAQNSCLDCHSVLDPPLKVTNEQSAADIHIQKGLTCASCHGGDPNSDDENAMSKKNGFRGKIARKDVPALCGKCHSDADFMRKYNPSLRTDQFSQYQTSVHGKLLAKGDTKVAVCIDCHSVHGIRPPSDTLSTVHPLNVATTCSRCHADATYMKGHNIPTDQFAKYEASVHHEAMTKRGDLSAPTCTSCHGNHGAAPPGVASVQNVCSSCHVIQAQLFDTSPHKKAFADAALPGCISCHRNHRIVHPSDAFLGSGPQSVCVTCHVEGDDGFKVARELQTQLVSLESSIIVSDGLLNNAEQSGMEISEARLEQDQAKDALTKARVSLHSANMKRVQQDLEAGMKMAAKTREAGQAALAERNYRRVGLGLSLLAILAVVIGLKLTITMIEKNG